MSILQRARNRTHAPYKPTVVQDSDGPQTLHPSLIEDDYWRRRHGLGWSPEKAAGEPYAPHGRRGRSPFNNTAMDNA